VTSWGDSEVSRRGATSNLDRNERPGLTLNFVPSTQAPDGPFDVVIVKIPRSLAFLEDQLRGLRPLLAADAVVIGAGMVKNVHNSTTALFEEIVGPTKTSLARRKARLIHPVYDPALEVSSSTMPTSYAHDGLTIVNHASVFSRERLDIGTRALLDKLPAIARGADVLDLGCGNGLVGTVAARQGAVVTFVDESFEAVSSAQATLAGSLPDVDNATFLVADATEGIEDASMDLVICNPPFHAHGARIDDIAWRMFSGAHRVLRPSGELVVVGNRNLGHHEKLEKVFGATSVIGSTDKFVVLRSVR
jgi:23S rRNA (guanine1835-N2)-methyltransferase